MRLALFVSSRLPSLDFLITHVHRWDVVYLCEKRFDFLWRLWPRASVGEKVVVRRIRSVECDADMRTLGESRRFVEDDGSVLICAVD